MYPPKINFLLNTIKALHLTYIRDEGLLRVTTLVCWK